MEVSKNSPLMAGFKKVYNLLKKENIEFVVITARGLNSTGQFMKSMEDDAKRVLDENENIKEVNNWGDIYRVICEVLNN